MNKDFKEILVSTEEINEICDCGALVKVIIETSQLSEQEIENGLNFLLKLR